MTNDNKQMTEDKIQKPALTRRGRYELSFLLENEENIEAVLGHLKNNDAEIEFKSDLSNIELSYPINKRTKAYFGYIRFSMPPANVKELRRVLQLDTNVLRILIITRSSEREDTNKPELDKKSEKSEKSDKPVEPVADNEVSNKTLEENLAALESSDRQ